MKLTANYILTICAGLFLLTSCDDIGSKKNAAIAVLNEQMIAQQAELKTQKESINELKSITQSQQKMIENLTKRIEATKTDNN